MWRLLVLGLAVGTTGINHDSDLEMLRARVLAPLLPNSATLATAVAAARHAAGTLSADGSWPDIDYDDISTAGRDHWQPYAHVTRLAAMAAPLVACGPADLLDAAGATASHDNGSQYRGGGGGGHYRGGNPLCNDTRLERDLAAALEYWLTRNPCSLNWYFNQIAAPAALANTLLLLRHGGKVAPATLAAADVDLRRGADWWRGWSGFNLVALAKLQIYRGLLLDDPALVGQGFDAVWSQLAPMPWPPPAPSQTKAATCNSSLLAKRACIASSCQVGGGSYLGDGIQADGSFHQHGAQLLDGAYGVALTESITGFLPVSEGLDWACRPAGLAVFAELVLQGQRRMSLPGPRGRPVFDWQVCGRGCTISAGVAGVSISGSGLRYAASLFPNGTGSAARGLTEYADELDGNASAAVAPDLLGSFAFYRSDYLLHRRLGWAASWKGRSNRTIAARCVNGDSKMSAETGEGSTFAYRTAEQGGAHAGIWPLIDWQQYPGTTVQQGGLEPCNWLYTYSHYPTFVGSVTDGVYGAAAQLLGNHELSARRSWLFTDAGFLSMVTDAKVSPANTTAGARHHSTPQPPAPVVLTTIANQRLAGPVTVVLTTGKRQVLPAGNHSFPAASLRSVEHNHTTYVLANISGSGVGGGAGNTIHVENGRRMGDYYRISTNHQPASGDVFRISCEHAAAGSIRGDVSYMVVPNAPATASPSRLRSRGSSEPPVEAADAVTTTKSAAAHVMADRAAGVTAVVFWAAGATTVELAPGHVVPITVNHPALLLIRLDSKGTDTIVIVSASNPDAASGVLLDVGIGSSASAASGSGCSLAPRPCEGSPPESSASAGCDDNAKAVRFALPDGQHMGKSVTCTVVVEKQNLSRS